MSSKKKKKKMRGKKTHGYGSKKKHRGKGSKGGKGMAGGLKHKKIKMMKERPDHFGKKGFKRKNKKEVKTINLKQIDEIARKKDKKKLSFPDRKVLGMGELKNSLEIEAKKFSKNAKGKIKEAGGKIIELS